MSAPYKYLSTLSNNPSSSGSLQPAMLRLVIYNNNLQSDHWMAVSVVTRRCHNISLTSDQINVRNTQSSVRPSSVLLRILSAQSGSGAGGVYRSEFSKKPPCIALVPYGPGERGRHRHCLLVNKITDGKYNI